MSISIINPGAIDIENIEFTEVIKYKVYEQCPDIEGKGVLVDLDFLLKEFAAIDDDGKDLITPCPSAYREWTSGAEAALRDIAEYGYGTPAKIWLQGSARPMFCNTGETDSPPYFSCACENCCGNEHVDTVTSIIERIEEEKYADLDDFMEFNDGLKKLVKTRNAQISKFDKKMTILAKKYFPKASVSLYSEISVDYLPGSFTAGPEYSVSPSMVSREHRGEILLQDVDDFRLAAALFNKNKDMLIMLPKFSWDFDMEDYTPEFRDYILKLSSEDAEFKYAAGRFLKSISKQEAL